MGAESVWAHGTEEETGVTATASHRAAPGQESDFISHSVLFASASSTEGT